MKPGFCSSRIMNNYTNTWPLGEEGEYSIDTRMAFIINFSMPNSAQN